MVRKEPPASAGEIRDMGLIPAQGRSLGGRRGNPLQYPSWRIPWTEEPGELQSIGSRRVATSWTRVKRLSMQKNYINNNKVDKGQKSVGTRIQNMVGIQQ